MKEKTIRRVGATLIDSIICEILFWIIIIICQKLFSLFQYINFETVCMFAQVVLLIYQYTFDILIQKQTIGKRAMRIRIESDNALFFKLLHSPMQMLNLLLWPLTSAFVIAKNEIPGDKKLGIHTINTDVSYSAEMIVRRILAEIVDLGIMLPIGGFLFAAPIILNSDMTDNEAYWAFFLIIFCFSFIYQTLSILILKYETLGLRAAGLEANNRRVNGIAKTILYGSAKVISNVFFFYSIPYLVINERMPYDEWFEIFICRDDTKR